MSSLFYLIGNNRLYYSYKLVNRSLHILKQSKKTLALPSKSYLLPSKHLCSDVEDKHDKSVLPHIYSEIYRFPLVRLGFVLHKLKWLQTLLSGAFIPVSFLLYLNELITYDCYFGVTGSCVIVTINLYLYAQLFHKAVGFMYISEDESIVKISYLDFWGNRIDEEVPVSDVVPFSDAPRPVTDILYKEIVFYSERKINPKLYLKRGQITDKEKFFKVFGSDENT